MSSCGATGLSCGDPATRIEHRHPRARCASSLASSCSLPSPPRHRALREVSVEDQGARTRGGCAERYLVSLGAPIRRAGQDPRTWLREALAALEVTKIRHPGNFRYAFPLGSSTQRRRLPIALPRTTYPKSATDILPV